MSKADVTTRFPFINLEKALKRAEQLYSADNRGRPMAIPTSFAAWGYSEKSSGGHQTVAALKMYGLADDSGANEDRRVQLTEAALRYFQEEREAEQNVLIQKFALNPKLTEAVWGDWGASPPSDAVARSQLKIDRKLNEQSARSFLGIYKDNLAFADIANSGTLKSGSLDKEANDDPEIVPANVGDFIQWSPNGVDQFSPSKRVRQVSEDSEWVFVDDSTTGIPMHEVTVEQPASAGMASPPTPPVLPLQTGIPANVTAMMSDMAEKEDEKEWVRTPLGKGAHARILVTDDLTDAQIDKLCAVLGAMKEGTDIFD